MTTTDSSDLTEFEVGASVPPWVRTAGLHLWNRYAAVNDEFVGIHMDDEAGRAAGNPGAFGMGNLIWAWLHNMLQDWLGERGRVEHVECRFRAPSLKGNVITCSGVVTEREVQPDGSTLLHLTLSADREEGDQLASAKATVRLAP
jgi:acyl dehydratase